MNELLGVALIGIFVGGLIGLAITFLPTIIAVSKGSSNRGRVVMLNFVQVGCDIVNWVLFGFLIPIPILPYIISLCLLGFWIYLLVIAIRGY